MGTQSANTLLCLLLCTLATYFSLCNGAPMAGCKETERKALLEFKAGLKHPAGSLSSWVGEDCCKWRGLQCDNRTGHVVHLHLRGKALGGEISSSLLSLRQLSYLDLSMNDFGGIHIPSFLGSFGRLRYLNISTAGFYGTVPQHLGNATSLHYLDLSAFPITAASPHSSPNNLIMDECHWISRLSSLRYISLNGVNLAEASNCLIQPLNTLQFLSEIHLKECELSSLPGSLPQANLTSLRVLQLSYNFYDLTIFDWLGNISSLEYLDVSGNNFGIMLSEFRDAFSGCMRNSLETLSMTDSNLTGPLPEWLGDLKNLKALHLSYNSVNGSIPPSVARLSKLRELDLSSNSLNGPLPKGLGHFSSTIGNLCRLTNVDLSSNNFGIMLSEFRDTFSGCIRNSLETLSMTRSNLTGLLPEWLGDLKNLKVLDLFYNSLNGTIPEGLGQLSQLISLQLSSNQLEGVLSEAHFANLTGLEVLDISSNHLSLDVRPDWVPPFRLREIWLGSCKLGPGFPSWLRKLENVSILDMSDAGITDNIPEWFWNFSSKLSYLSLSGNGLKGKVPISLKYSDLGSVYLDNNQLKGPLPQFSSKLGVLTISNNSFSGPIPEGIDDMMPSLSALSLSANNFYGGIPLSLCKLKNLDVLDLSKNNFSGELPNCWNDGSRPVALVVMDLSYNRLHGHIPTSLGSLPSMKVLHLNHNNLSGELPLSLNNCKGLISLDLGENQFSGSIPSWMGGSLVNLKNLRLRSNNFVGHIPPQLGNLTSLQVIDLAFNDLSGTIPHNFGNFSAMKLSKEVDDEVYYVYSDGINVWTKGRPVYYDKALLSLVILVDLSHNSLSGEIPEELSALSHLQTFNLSHNHLTGKITEKISGLKCLETLDLSVNNLSGTIPSAIASLSFLNHLNLSYNNLSGEIPYAGQLQALPDASIYAGNDKLCGSPLEKKCHVEGAPQELPGQEEGEGRGDSEMRWFYLGLGPGFVTGFWAFCGMLLLKNNWRIAYFRYVNDMYDKVYVAVVVNVRKMTRHMDPNRG